MTTRLISNAALWHLHSVQGRIEAIQDWARVNGLDPSTVPADANLTIEDSPDGRVIRHAVFVRSDSGAKLVDPVRSGEPLVEQRVVPLVVEPPEGWPVYVLPDR